MDDSKIGEFVSVTHASIEDARSFLERANGDLTLAVAAYMAEFEDSVGPAAGPTAGPSTLSGTSAGPAQKPVFRQSKPKFASFSDLARQDEEAERDAARGHDPQDLFTGGERSGLAVQPHQEPQNASDLVNKIMQQAQRNAPRPNANFNGFDADDAEEEESASSKSRRKAPTFKGSGARLGAESDAPAEEPAQSPEGVPPSLQNWLEQYRREEESSNEVQERTLNFWNEGFSVDDGPLYRFDDPANQAYLQAIHAGRAPMSLLNVRARQPVDVKVVERHSDYIKPAATLQNSGPGQRLGSPTPSDRSSAMAAQAHAQQVVEAAKSKSQPAEPTLGREGNAVVQIRLANGSTHRARFDRAGPVQQLYDFVDEVDPTTRPYVLQLPMPPKKLEDKQQLLESAGAVGAVVVQRWA